MVRIKKKVEGKLGEEPGKRDVEKLLKKGLIKLDKPSGPDSHQVAHWVKKILKVEKAGHGGTLDPNATGVLPIGLGKATKTLGLLLEDKKEYIGLAILHSDISYKKVKKALKTFKGEIKQVPPVKSAVKREERTREVYKIKLLEKEDRKVLFKIECESGTYIRKIAHALGEKLNIGAHLKELRRTKSGPFLEKDAITLYDLEDAYAFWKEQGLEDKLKELIKPVEFIVKDLPKIWVFDSAVETLTKGAPLYAPGISKVSKNIEKGETVALMTLKGELIGLGKAKMNTKEMLKKGEGKASTIDSTILDTKTKY